MYIKGASSFRITPNYYYTKNLKYYKIIIIPNYYYTLYITPNYYFYTKLLFYQKFKVFIWYNIIIPKI